MRGYRDDGVVLVDPFRKHEPEMPPRLTAAESLDKITDFAQKHREQDGVACQVVVKSSEKSNWPAPTCTAQSNTITSTKYLMLTPYSEK